MKCTLCEVKFLSIQWYAEKMDFPVCDACLLETLKAKRDIAMFDIQKLDRHIEDLKKRIELKGAMDMRDELEQRLMDDFPFMEAKSFFDGERLGHCVPCEFSDGWFDIIYNLCKEIDELYKSKNRDIMELNVEQAKEKFGELRFYVGNYIDGVMEIIDKYETLSCKTCEVCGKEGSLRGKRWVRTLCDDCNKA